MCEEEIYEELEQQKKEEDYGYERIEKGTYEENN